MDNLVKFIDGSNPREPPHVMLAVDQNNQVRLWQIRTIHQHEAITVDYGGQYWLNCGTRLSKKQQRNIRVHYKHILFPPDWPHMQDITEKRIGKLEWEYAVVSRNVYDTLRDIDESDDSDDGDNTKATGTIEDIQECTVSRGTLQRDHNFSITDWARSNEAPPERRTKTLPLTPDATIKAIHEALKNVAQKSIQHHT